MSESDKTARRGGRSGERSLVCVLNVVVALAPEARPLVDHWGLRPLGGEEGRSPRVFVGEVDLHEGWWVSLRLVVGGIGRVAAATAVGVLHGVGLLSGPEDDVTPRLVPEAGDATTPRLPVFWLNVGICGHGRRPVGDVILADAVHDMTAGHCVELHRAFEAPCDVVAVETHDAVVSRYPGADRAVDMEAAGFVAAARGCGAVGGDPIQCLKVVSDNAESPPRDVTRRAARRVLTMAIEGHMAKLVPILDVLLARWIGVERPRREV